MSKKLPAFSDTPFFQKTMADHDAINAIVPVDDHPHYYQDQLKHALAGGSAAVVTRVFVQPLDVLKIRFQLQVEPFSSSYYHRSKYHSLYQASACIFREEGVRAFWKGHVPAQLLSVMYGMAQFWGYEILKDKSKEMHWHQGHKNFSNFICGKLLLVFALPDARLYSLSILYFRWPSWCFRNIRYHTVRCD